MKKLIEVNLAIDLLQIVWPDFVEVDGSVFLARAMPDKLSDPHLGLDRTGTEASANHVHVSYLFGHNASRHPKGADDHKFLDSKHPDFLLLCQAGKTLASIWFQKLQADFPNYDFRVYYTQEDDPIVRFHRVRSDEPNWLDESNYPIDKVLVFDTRKKMAGIGGA